MSRYLQNRGQGESEGVTGRETGGKGLEGGRRRRNDRQRNTNTSTILVDRVPVKKKNEPF